MTTINTIEDLIRLLDENPQWAEALRARLLTRELIELPEKFAQFAADATQQFANIAQQFEQMNQRFEQVQQQFEQVNQRFEQVQQQFEQVNQRFEQMDRRFEQVDQRFEQMDRRFEQMDQRFERVDQRFEQVDQRFEQMDRRFEQMDQRFERVDQRLDGVDGTINRILVDLGYLKGAHARNVAIDNAASIARDMGLRRVRNLSQDDLLEIIDAADTSALTAGELRSFRQADLVIESLGSQGEYCYIAVEISFTANGRDTARATRNARLLTAFTGRPAYAAIAGVRRDDRIQENIRSGEVVWHELDSSDLEAE
jgi:chromosome segregation ATPase